MPHFVVLLRGVNVGKSKRVPMAGFRTLLSGLGYSNASTLLNSGNAVFQAETGTPGRHAAAISAALRAEMEVDVPVIVKSAAQFARVVSECPIAVDPGHHSRFLLAFTQDPQSLSTLASLQPLVTQDEQFAIGSQAAYLLCASGILESKTADALLGKLGKFATTRNWSTVLKLHALATGDA